MPAPFSLRVAQMVLRCYPPAWRRRYAEEVRALLDESQPAWTVAVDLAAGAVREWVSPRHPAWPTRQALTRAQLTLFLAFYIGPLIITWLSQVFGGFVRSEVGPMPAAGDTVAAIMWTAATTWLTTGAIRNSVAVLRRSPRVPVMLGRNALIGLAVLALLVGIFESASGAPAISSFWLVSVMPFARNFTLGGLACGQSARMVRISRLQQVAASRRRRDQLLKHVGPTLHLGGGGTPA